MTKPNNSKTKLIWLSVLVLLVCVTATVIGFFSRLDSFFLDDKGAISLITQDASGTDDSTDEDEDTQSSGSASSVTPQPSQASKNPGYEASDEQTVWRTDTQLEIFRIAYVNGEQVVTVNSENGEKSVAPGTENSYTFKLKNTGNTALDYSVEVDAYFTPEDIEIPITGRLSRYDSKWVVGGEDEYAKVYALDAAEDKATLGAGKYTYYTLDWLWPFESGNDELDTALGNLAVDQDLIFTVAIKTVAVESTDLYDDSGITPPNTGYNINLTLWIVLALGSFAIMMFPLFCQNKKRRNYHAEADKS